MLNRRAEPWSVRFYFARHTAAEKFAHDFGGEPEQAPDGKWLVSTPLDGCSDERFSVMVQRVAA